MIIIPAQAGIPSGLFDAFCFQIFAKQPGDRFYAE
jgi:hypothetical protein